MARDVSIAISVRDNFTQAITTMKNANQAFNKDITGLQTKLDALNKTKLTLKIDTDRARRALKEAEKAFLELGEAAGEEHLKQLQKANEAYEQSRRNLKLVADEARRTEKALSDYSREVSKAENKAGVGGTQSLLSGLASAGMIKIAGDMAANITAGMVGSIYGLEGGIFISNLLSGITSGAAVGSLAGGPAGTALGAAIGGGIGIVNAGVGLFTAQDEAFKSVVQERYAAAKQELEDMLTRGTGIAGSREQMQISFATLLGSEDAARDYLSKMTEFAETTPFGYDQLAEMSKIMLAYGYQVDELLTELTKVGDAGSALGMTAADMNFVVTSLGRMRTTGKTALKYLNPLLERGIPVWDYLAKAAGKTKAEVQEMVSKGLVPGEEAAKAISDYMGAEFTGNMEKQSKTYQGLISALKDAQDALDAAMGEGYNEERKKGIQAQIEFLEGEGGERFKEANRLIGEWRASLDNLAEEYEREALNAVMTGTTTTLFNSRIQSKLREMYDKYTEYALEGTEEAGAKMGSLLAEAQVIAQNEYMASEGAKLQLQVDRELAQKIREDTSLQNEYWNAGYVMGKEFAKGRMAGASTTQGLEPDYGVLPGTYLDLGRYQYNPTKHAYGISYVPYDNFPALLHQGERVLTASEARNNSKTVPQVSITGNVFNVRDEDDIDKIGEEILRKIISAYGVT